MIQTSSKMSKRVALGFVCLIYSFAIVCGCGAQINGATTDCHSKTCGEIVYDPHEAVCCEGRLYPGTGLSCCGEKTFNPATDTCCKNTIQAYITPGLSESVSSCCGLMAYNSLNEICCDFTIIAKPAAKASCCGKEAIDEDNQMCCNNTILPRPSSNHLCCGNKHFDKSIECCCFINGSLEIKANDSECCVEQQEKLYCGPNKTALLRKSSRHECCGGEQFDSTTDCCCFINGSLEIRPASANCCQADRRQQQKDNPINQPSCLEPKTNVCQSTRYDPDELNCCERKQAEFPWCCGSGQCDVVPTLYNPRTHICCDGCVFPRSSWTDQCCGETPYGSAQRGVLCCNNTLYKDREDGDECSELGIPYNPDKGTTCCTQFHGTPGHHCCGTEIYQPHTEICCDGHRHPKEGNTHCCGIKAYNIKDPQMKCCMQTLYNLTLSGKKGHDTQCCGSLLLDPQDVCCSGEDEEVRYLAKAEFRCCGHLYYNSSLWSCCAGKLIPAQSTPVQDVKRLSVNNLNNTDICEELLIGTVGSVSSHSIVFNSVLKIHARHANVKPLRFHVLKTPHRCNSPKVIPGKTYFFDELNVFTDFNYDSALGSLHVILSKCYHP